MAEIFLYLVNMSITASWLIVAVIILRLLLKKAPKWVHCLLWCLVGIRLLIPFSIESVFSLIPSAKTVPREILYETSPVIDSGMESVNQAVNPLLQGSFAPNPGDSVNPLQIVTFLASCIWVLGMVILLLYTGITYIRLKRYVREAVRLEGNIYQSERVSSPFVLGVVRPRIYLPYAIQGEELACVIAHEQSHIRRKDHLWKPLAFLVLTVYWFNPLVWLAYILLCRDIEYACDEKVLATLGANVKKTYSTALLHCSISGGTTRRIIAACPVAFGEVGVKGRIKSVLNYKKPAFWVIVVAIIACVVCAVCFLTNPKEEADADMTSGQDAVSQEEATAAAAESEALEETGSPTIEPVIIEKSEDIWIMDETRELLQNPPPMILKDALSSTLNYFKVESGTYSWNYRSAENSEEMVGLEASGAAPQVAVKGQEWLRVVDYNRIDYAVYAVSFDVEPDRITVREFDSLELGDIEAEVLSETVYEDVFFIELRARRIYEVIAEWDEENLDTNGFYGNAYYAFATDNTMLDLEDAVTIEAQVKEVMADKEECIVITSKTDDFPGAFMLKVPSEVYDEDNLQGGEMILVTMRDTKLEENNLPVYKALYLEKQEAQDSGM